MPDAANFRSAKPSVPEICAKQRWSQDPAAWQDQHRQERCLQNSGNKKPDHLWGDRVFETA
jgi:hypothetical protein